MNDEIKAIELSAQILSGLCANPYIIESYAQKRLSIPEIVGLAHKITAELVGGVSDAANEIMKDYPKDPEVAYGDFKLKTGYVWAKYVEKDEQNRD